MTADIKQNPSLPTTAFVAGATGFTGKAVVRELVESGVRTVAHVRPDSPKLSDWEGIFREAGAEVDVTSWDEEAMAEAMARIEPGSVFALLGTVRARMKAVKRAGGDPRTAGYDAVDYGLTAMLIRAAVSCGSTPRFVYLSAAGAADGASSPYYKARVKAEAELKASGLPYVIARPGFITGPGRDDPRPMERVGAAITDGLLSAAGALGAKKLCDRYRSTTDQILARALVRLALDPEANNLIAESEDLRD